MRVLSDLIGTLRNSFAVGRAKFDASGVATDRTYELPDSSGVIALRGDVDTYATAAIASGVLALDASVAKNFGVILDANVTTLTLSGAVSGGKTTIEVLFSQSSAGGFSVTKPNNVRLAEGFSSIASTAPRDITKVRFSTVDAGTTWLMDMREVFVVPPAISLPTIADENSTFNDEGTATTGWTTSNATLSVSGSRLRQTKTSGGSNSSMSKTISTFTPSNADYCLYFDMSAKYRSGDTAVAWLLNGSKEVSIWLGSANASSAHTLGAISICGTTGSSTRNVTQIASGVDYETNPVRGCLQFDPKFTSLTCWLIEADGRWKFAGRVACDWFSSANIQLLTTTASAAGAWVEFDYLTLAKPNLLVIGDSIPEGKTLFSPNRGLGLTNDESTWMRHAPIYPELRNNLIVNKGVGSETSTATLARYSEAVDSGARVVFLHASTNDQGASISLATRTSNIQSMIDDSVSGGQAVVLMNAVYGTSTAADNTPTPDLKDYMLEWKEDYAPTLTDVAAFVDIMDALRGTDDFMDPALTQSDKLHPNPSGFAPIGGMFFV
jgi:lysophospholipase L1-like esterase